MAAMDKFFEHHRRCLYFVEHAWDDALIAMGLISLLWLALLLL